MKFLALVVLAYLAQAQGFGGRSGIPVEELTDTPKIIGGQESLPHAFPHQVYLQTHRVNGVGGCGGSIIRADLILTAAHCVDGGLYIEVFAGAHNLSQNEPNRQLLISTNFIMHEAWDRSRLINDIAIVILPVPFRLDGNTTNAISLRYGGCPDTSLDGRGATISGWGKQFNSSTAGAAVLRFVSSTIMTRADCAAFYLDGMILDSQICFSGAGIRGACQGDSGGPMTIYTSGGGLQLVGVTSFVSAVGCEEGAPSVYVRVSCYTDWILSKVPR